MTAPLRDDSTPVQPLRPALERGRRLTDVGNAERFVMRHGDDVRYCHTFGKWFCWDGTRYRIDDNGEVERRAKETVASIYTEAAEGADKAERRAIVQHATASETARRISALLMLASSDEDVIVRPDQLDADPMALNVANGTVDLASGYLGPHSRDALCTKLVPITFDYGAKCPRWLQFLDTIFRVERMHLQSGDMN